MTQNQTGQFSDEKMLQDVVTENHIGEKQDLSTPTTDDLSILVSSVEEDKIDSIDNNNDNNNKKISILLTIPYTTLHTFQENVNKKYGKTVGLDSELTLLISEFNKQFEKQHLTTSLLYDGKEPRLDVLKKLEKISDVLDLDDSFPFFSKSLLEKIITSTIGQLDQRTMRKYLMCLRDFSSKVTGKQLGYYERYDLTGFPKTILEKLHQAELGE